MGFRDDELVAFDETGALPLPVANASGYVTHNGGDIWYASYGQGPAVILLHGGLGNAGNWGHQVPALLAAGFSAIVIDSRGHGRSTRDGQPYTYHLMAGDVLAVMDALGLDKAAFVGWSDGACTALVLSDLAPERSNGVLFFACNMDPSGAKPFEPSVALDHCFSRHRKDYAALSATPDAFDAFVEAVSAMQRTEPNYTPEMLAAITVPVTVVQSEFDEFITPEHARYLADTIPGAKLVELDGVSHFAPLQRPEVFNAAMLDFLART